MKIESDSIELIIQYLGYERVIESISLLENKFIITKDFELSPSYIDLEVTEIKGEKETRQTLTQYGWYKLLNLSYQHFHLQVEADIFRTLQSLPGFSVI